MSLLAITVLRRARKLIAEPGRWVQGAFRKRKKGVECYCGLGAVATAAGVKIRSAHLLSEKLRLPEEYYEAHNLLNLAVAARSDAPSGFFANYNDRADVTQSDVLSVFDAAIRIARKKSRATW